MIAIKRFIFLFAIACTVLLGPFLFGYHFTAIKATSLEYLHAAKQGGHSRDFHLLLPATGPNLHFCRLLLSAAVTGWPEPIFVGWDGRGMYNGSESHLFKITETLTYLRSLPASADQDLVLVLDAYDIWLQLRPDVMIERYYNVLRKNDVRVKEEGLLHKYAGGGDVHHSIVFGPDKIHWPQGDESAAVWAAPESPLPLNAFGPDTDTDMFTARPRWLNSGTIMGPAKDMRDMFSATVDMLSRKFDSGYEFRTSDQLYFAEVWAEQEVNRMRARDGENFDEHPQMPNGIVGIVPEIPASRRTEYHICLDYETEIFQAAAAYDRHLTWMRWNQSTLQPHPNLKPKDGDPEAEVASGLAKELRIDRWQLSEEIRRSAPPFAAASRLDNLPREQTWEQTMLGTNVVTTQAFPLFHVTGDKSLRDRWWPRMWFHPYSEQLLRATKKRQIMGESEAQGKNDEQRNLLPGQYVFANVRGVKWKGAIPVRESRERKPVLDEKGGAWVDNGDYVPWNDMCKTFEDDELYVPASNAGKDGPEVNAVESETAST